MSLCLADWYWAELMMVAALAVILTGSYYDVQRQRVDRCTSIEAWTGETSRDDHFYFEEFCK